VLEGKPHRRKPYRVEEFSPDAFDKALGREPLDEFDKRRPFPEEIAEHPQATNLYTHLEKLGVKTIVVEKTYVDGSFLTDYATFYATVFARFDRFCKRVHFFSLPFEESRFLRYLMLRDRRSDEIESFAASYLGFVVSRPLPKAVVGRTVLAPIPTRPGEGSRYYRAVVDTPVNLFGAHLTVENSLPFQQQDRAVAACATVALWSAFFRTAAMFGTPAARPSAITRAATTSLYQDRAWPSTNLTIDQICEAVRVNGLEPEVFDLERTNKIPVLSLIRAYLEAGLPVVLGVEHKGSLHAVTAVGYRQSASPKMKRELEPQLHDTPSVARAIDVLYCHDDNIGPFAEFGIRGNRHGGHIRLTSKLYPIPSGKTPSETAQPSDGELTKSTKPKKPGSADLDIVYVIIPCNDSVRLNFGAVQEWVTSLDLTLLKILGKSLIETRVWDVKLTTTSVLKRDITSDTISHAEKIDFLTEAQPRFMWQISFRTGAGEAFRLFADASAFELSLPLRRAIIFDRKLVHETAVVLKETDDADIPGAAELAHFFTGELAREIGESSTQAGEPAL